MGGCVRLRGKGCLPDVAKTSSTRPTPDRPRQILRDQSLCCHPLFSAGRVIGTLSFGTRTRTTFAEEELSLMKTVADQVAIAMEGQG